MKIVKLKLGEVTEGTVADPRGTITQLHDEPAKGFFRQVRLNGAGLVVARRGVEVLFPLAELLALAEQAEPALVPVAAPSAAVAPEKTSNRKVAK